MKTYCEIPVPDLEPCRGRPVAAILMIRRKRTFGFPLTVCQQHLDEYRDYAARHQGTHIEIVEGGATGERAVS